MFVNTDRRSGGEGEKQGGSWPETALIVGADLHERLVLVDASDRVSVSLVVSLSGLLLAALRHALEALHSDRSRTEWRKGEAVAEGEDAQGVAAVGVAGAGNARAPTTIAQARLQAEARVSEDRARLLALLVTKQAEVARARKELRRARAGGGLEFPPHERLSCTGAAPTPSRELNHAGQRTRAAYALATAASRNARARSHSNPAEPDRCARGSSPAVPQQSSRGVAPPPVHTGFAHLAQLQEQLRDVARAQWANV